MELSEMFSFKPESEKLFYTLNNDLLERINTTLDELQSNNKIAFNDSDVILFILNITNEIN